MIFLTVGTQLHFDRLVRAVDQALSTRTGLQVFAQIAEGNYRPKHMEFSPFLSPRDFERHFSQATHIIGHAGMGTIIQSLLQQKPILIMPRRAALGEQRNDHQLATARRFGDRAGVLVAEDEHQLAQQLDSLAHLTASQPISPFANPELIDYIAKFISVG